MRRPNGSYVITLEGGRTPEAFHAQVPLTGAPSASSAQEAFALSRSPSGYGARTRAARGAMDHGADSPRRAYAPL